jgi:hypothetical protein
MPFKQQSFMISKKDVQVPAFYDTYINAVKENDLAAALKKSLKQFLKTVKNIPSKKIDYAYAEGKWTVREMLQHMIDAERVFAYRALWFARKDQAPLPGFDEKNWAVTANASKRDWDDMIEEFSYVRKSTQALFAAMDEEQLRSSGVANNNTINVAGLGFVCAGHLNHHLRVLQERYLTKNKNSKKKKK